MSQTTRVFIFVVGLLLWWSVAVMAEEVRVRSYPLPDHGKLQLKVPVSWKDELQQPPSRLPPTIVFKPTRGAAFEVLLTTIWPAKQDTPRSTPEEMRRQVERAAEGAKSQAIEKVIEVKELKGSSGLGYYFSATDRAPAPGEYKYMTQGMIRIGGLIGAFTILTNDGQTSVITDAIAMIGSANQVND